MGIDMNQYSMDKINTARIDTGEKDWRGRRVVKSFFPILPTSSSFFLLPPVSILAVFILSIGSEEVLLFLVLLIHINIHNRMEIIFSS